ncbi:MAG: T9SS type A sorting domain-containing protein [Flavobacteriales bacterium]|nr:T9SS type A sorting domain-containing protein [Flavobacteriales bacterium]
MARALHLILIVLFIAAWTPGVMADEKDNPTVEQSSSLKLGQNYPNPASDKTYIDVQFNSAEATLTIYNVVGELIEQQTIVDKRIILDVSNYTEGVYLYTLEADGQKITKRLTVKKH